METFISAPLALVIVGAISVMLLSFGFFVGKKVSKSSNDFLYAGRNVGLALSTATLISLTRGRGWRMERSSLAPASLSRVRM